MYSTVVLLLPALSHCVTVTLHQPGVTGKSKVELTPMLITCGLNDIAIISAPAVGTDSDVYLHKPTGDVIKLDIPKQTVKNYIKECNEISDYDNICNNNSKYVRTLNPDSNFRVFSASDSDGDIVKAREKVMKGNEFMIGPLLEEDHGNWVLSVYLKDIDDNWTELFQVISVEIVERVPVLNPLRLRAGDAFYPSFAYSIPDLQSCELIAPNTTYDRYYDRDRTGLDRCGYVVENVTREDAGVWKIVGVGRVVYVGHANLEVLD